MRTTRFFRAAVVPPAATVDGVRKAETIVADSKGSGVSGLCVSFTSSRVGRANDCRNDALERGAVVKRLNFPHASGVAGGKGRVTRLLFIVRQHTDVRGVVVRTNSAHSVTGQAVVGIVIVLDRETELFQVVRALHPAGRFTSRLDCRQEQPNQNADNRNDDQEFDEGKTPARNLTLHNDTSV